MNQKMLDRAAEILVTAANEKRDGARTYRFKALDVLNMTNVSLANFETRYNLMWSIMNIDRVTDTDVSPTELEIEFAKEAVA